MGHLSRTEGEMGKMRISMISVELHESNEIQIQAHAHR